ncbi:heme o synthase [Salinicoccus roseus]|uniref:heme o synthase n=1 Tax=Salinicoccus roseus TaxID=45670 RepID=UPI001EF5C4FF|nr:heme o synthase [Salinicoccus roseus]MCG7331692.1 heme o synthase [Salinicoccus roseus]
MSINSKLRSFLTDMKYLLKGKVLLANVLPVFTAYWLALHFSGARFMDHLGLFLLTMAGSTLVISGALMLNNWYESDLDMKMDRTRNRPTVTGAFPLRAVLSGGIATTIIGLSIMMFTTFEAAIYSFLGWFFYVVLYTFWTKRRYTLNTIIGSISGAFTPLIGWAVITPADHIVPIALFYLLFIWQIPHTLAIAIKRLEDYTRAGVPMLPVVSGIDATIRQIIIYVIALLPFPFILADSMGWAFSTFALALTIFWIILAAMGPKAGNKKVWAQMNLRYSIIYLSLILFSMVLITFFTG